jgi:hypothetical protein
MATIPDFWQIFKVYSYFHPILIWSSLIGFSLPIFILIGRIIFIKRNLEAVEDSEDILDVD